MTICAKCKHHKNTSPSGDDMMWYWHACTNQAVRIKPKVDPVTGRMKPEGDGLFPNCHNINPIGECEHYEKRLLA